MNKNKGGILVWLIIFLGICWVMLEYIKFENEIGPLDSFYGDELIYPYYKIVFFEKVGSKILIVAIAVIGILIINMVKNIIKLYNEMVSLREKYENALSSVDIYLKERFDLIPNLVQTVKAYANYEKETIESIVKLRAEFNRDDKNLMDRSALDNEYNTLIAKVEAYPELKANENFLELQKQLAKMENQIQAARRTYNMQATNYNILIQKFPNIIVANILGFKEQNLLEAIAKEKQGVNIS